MDDNTAVDLEGQLKEAKREIDYYKSLAEQEGNLRLKETEQLSSLINELRKTAKALEESEGRYRLHFENVRDVIFSLDRELAVLEVTPSVLMTLGWSPNELVGRRFTDLNILAPNESLRALEDSRRLLAGEIIESRIYSFIQKNGTIRVGEVSGAPLRRHDEIIGAVCVARDITDRLAAESALKASEEKYRSIIEAIEEGYFEVDLKGNMVLFNDAACTVLGYSREELTGLNYREYADEENVEKVFETFNAVFTTGQPAKLTDWVIVRNDGTRRIVETPVMLMYDDEGRPCGFRGLGRDVTDLRLAEEALRRSRDELEQQVGERTAQLVRSNADLRQQIKEREQAEERYRTLVELAPMSIMIHTEGRIVFMNTFAAKAFGASSPKEFFGSSVFDLMDPHLRELSAQRIEWMLKEWKSAPVMEMSGQRVDGSPGWAEIHSAPILYDGHPSIMVIGIDVTERRAADDRLRASLREKEILLREVHHRVKNNLQLMSSLLALQGMHCDGRDADTVLRDAESRVWAMALAHETLYRSNNMSEISPVDYLGTLVGNVLESSSADGSKVSVITDFEDGSLKIDHAINCGLILNELITNSLKHAFPGDREGELTIGLRFGERDSVYLSVADNGVGIPPNIDITSAESFGLDLVKTLVEELNGDIDLNRAHGSEVRINFRQS